MFKYGVHLTYVITSFYYKMYIYMTKNTYNFSMSITNCTEKLILPFMQRSITIPGIANLKMRQNYKVMQVNVV